MTCPIWDPRVPTDSFVRSEILKMRQACCTLPCTKAKAFQQTAIRSSSSWSEAVLVAASAEAGALFVAADAAAAASVAASAASVAMAANGTADAAAGSSSSAARNRATVPFGRRRFAGLALVPVFKGRLPGPMAAS